jgi:hypothetical protein
VLAALRERTWSASSLELWLACPARWLIERMLRPASPEPDPEPLARGGLAHAALADTLSGLRERVGSARVTPARLEMALELLAQALARHEPRFELSARAERRPGARRRLEADLERYLRHLARGTPVGGTPGGSAERELHTSIERGSRELAERGLHASSAHEPGMSAPHERSMSAAREPGMSAAREPGMSAAREPGMSSAHEPGTFAREEEAVTGDACQLEPRWFELGFGFGEEEEGGLPALDLGEGVMLRGRIDRIDVTPGGKAVVYDYKGARVTPGAKWIEEGKIQLALYMRAARQLLGLHVVGGLYQPLGGADLRARGALDGGAGLDVECVRTDLMSADELEELVQDAVKLAREAAAQARAGALQARPRTCAFTQRCAHPAICRSGR